MAEPRPGEEFRDTIVRQDLLEAKFLSTFGYLQEVNRRFFHPLGLALSVRMGMARENVRTLLQQNGYAYDDAAVDACWPVVALLGLDRPHVVGVHDGRDDPEGVVFDVEGNQGELTDAESIEKAGRVLEEMDARRRPRMDALGYVVQPVRGIPR